MRPHAPTPANRLGLDYRQEARRLGAPVVPIIDAHTHIVGTGAVEVYAEVASLFGVACSLSMTPLRHAAEVRDRLGRRVRFIAVPDWRDPDRARAFRQGYLRDIDEFRHRYDARIAKIWHAPRWLEICRGPEWDDIRALDSPWRIRIAEHAQSLGMALMVHIADPDTWFATRYADAGFYGTKADQYAALERMLARFPGPWIAAHMGGWPENLAFLDGLLQRHANLYLDCSATKWMVRELSRHDPDHLAGFFARWEGRILFGTDIVTTDEHLAPAATEGYPVSALAASREEAFDLYASRYWAMRTLLETSYRGESPIADPDLSLVDPGRFSPMSAPELRGCALPAETLRSLYSGAASALLGDWVAPA